MRVDETKGLTDFLAQTRHLSWLEVRGSEIWAGGWSWPDVPGAPLDFEDVSVLQHGYLQGMDLRGCGTLMLGACESGMAQRTERDERIGFVRAAVHAGAAAVVAARWVAADAVAASVLDRFERYVRYLPRDLALQQAQLDVYRRAPGTPVDLPALDHPARWACWTLYGDSGPTGPSLVTTFRKGASTSLPSATNRFLINSSFGHLIPW